MPIYFSGVTGTEILFGLVVTQFLVMIGQTIMVLVVAFGVFEVTCEGDLIPVTVLTILTGLCGMCFGKLLKISLFYSKFYCIFWSIDFRTNKKLTTLLLKVFLNFVFSTGFVVACACENERSATYMAMGSFLPIVMLCGIIWPIEGMHEVLRYISFILPLTKSTESFRAMVARGWTIDNPVVYEGFIATFIWIAVFLTLAILLLKFKKGWFHSPYFTRNFFYFKDLA